MVLQGRDLLGAARTGTGKTAGFALPLLQLLFQGATKARGRAPRALVLTPTRELASQVEESFREYGKYLGLSSTVVFGGVNINRQIDALKAGTDILVATPGRLLDHVGQRTVNLSQVEFLVLDEADRMLDMGFIRDIRKILALLPAKRQNLLFSATFSEEIRSLASSFLSNPASVDASPKNSASELVTQAVYMVRKEHKRELLTHLISRGGWDQVLVFTKTKHGANRLAQQLVRDGISADAIHGNKSQSRRTRSLADFKSGELRVLVATDIAARGLDIEELPHVVNFDLPMVAEDYVHRIGRTGRAGCTGEALSLVCAEDAPLLAAVERLTRLKIERRQALDFQPPAAPKADETDDRPERPRQNPGRGRSGPSAARPGQHNGNRGSAQPRGASSGNTARATPPRDSQATRTGGAPAAQPARAPTGRRASATPALLGGRAPGTRGR